LSKASNISLFGPFYVTVFEKMTNNKNYKIDSQKQLLVISSI